MWGGADTESDLSSKLVVRIRHASDALVEERERGCL